MPWPFRTKAKVGPAKVDPPADETPAQEVAVFGPVARHNHIAYVPSGDWARVPGVGTGNLAYVPDFMLSPPEWFAGVGTLRTPNSIMIAVAPAFVNAPKQVVEGIGGVVAGQTILQPLLEVNINNGNTGTE